MGTSVVSGTATAVVVKTGGLTEYGKIAKKLVEKAPETEFERGIKRFRFPHHAGNFPLGHVCFPDYIASQPNNSMA